MDFSDRNVNFSVRKSEFGIWYSITYANIYKFISLKKYKHQNLK